MNEYIRDMAASVSAKKWIDSNYDQRIAISTRTFNTLEALEGDTNRQATVFRFATRVFPDFECLKSTYDEKEPPKIPPRKIQSSENPDCSWPSNISLKKIRLNGFRIDGTNSIYRGTLKAADLSGADLEGADFTLADLRNTNFKNTNLRGSQFSDATILGGADFTGSTLDEVVFDGTDLRSIKKSEQLNSLYSNTISFLYERLAQLNVGNNQSSVWAKVINNLLEKLKAENRRINIFYSTLNDAKYTVFYITKHPSYIEKDLFPSDFAPTIGDSESKFCQKVTENKIKFAVKQYSTLARGANAYNGKLEISNHEYPELLYNSRFKKKYGCLP